MSGALDTYLAGSACPERYLDFARFGPPLRPVAAAIEHAARLVSEEPWRIDELDGDAERARSLAARLTGFRPDQVTLTANTSLGLFHTAFGLPPGEVLVSPFEFPANVYPWVRAAERGGPQVRWLLDPEGPPGRVTPDLVASRLSEGTVALAVSAVSFADGFRADLPGLREVLGERLLVVDAIQGLGALDLPWSVADVISTGGQKWLRAGWGIGFLACGDRALDRLGAGLSGWTGASAGADPRALGGTHPPSRGADRFSMTAPDPIAVAGLAAALGQLDAVGVTEIDRRIVRLVERCRQGLGGAGAVIASPEPPERRSGIVAFRVDGQAPGTLVAALAAAAVTVSERQGHVRAAIHATTTEAAVDRMLDVVAGAA